MMMIIDCYHDDKVRGKREWQLTFCTGKRFCTGLEAMWGRAFYLQATKVEEIANKVDGIHFEGIKMRFQAWSSEMERNKSTESKRMAGQA